MSLSLDDAKKMLVGFGVTGGQSISHEVRRFLSDSYGFLRGVNSTGLLAAYSLEQAIADRLRQIDGTPRHGGRNLLERIDHLLLGVTTAVAAAQLLEVEDLSEGALSGLVPSELASSLGGLTNSLPDVDAALSDVQGTVDSALPGELHDAVGGKLPSVSTAGQKLQELV